MIDFHWLIPPGRIYIKFGSSPLLWKGGGGGGVGKNARYTFQDPSIRWINEHCPIQSRLQFVLGVRSSYVEHNKFMYKCTYIV